MKNEKCKRLCAILCALVVLFASMAVPSFADTILNSTYITFEVPFAEPENWFCMASDNQFYFYVIELPRNYPATIWKAVDGLHFQFAQSAQGQVDSMIVTVFYSSGTSGTDIYFTGARQLSPTWLDDQHCVYSVPTDLEEPFTVFNYRLSDRFSFNSAGSNFAPSIGTGVNIVFTGQYDYHEYFENLIDSLDTLRMVLNGVATNVSNIYSYLRTSIIDAIISVKSSIDGLLEGVVQFRNAFLLWLESWVDYKDDVSDWWTSLLDKVDQFINGTPEQQEQVEQNQEKVDAMTGSLDSASDSLGAVSKPDMNVSEIIPGDFLATTFVNYTNVLTVVWESPTLVSMVTTMVGFLLIALLLFGKKA